jgi:2-polyprenyl-3-methyl-5-hydroxy-6-metoxy-1,4-benzoquinol methylase
LRRVRIEQDLRLQRGSIAQRLARKFDYVNTFFDGEPRFDITETHPDQYGTYDFIISADVFEHVPPPVRGTRSGRAICRPRPKPCCI